MTTKLTNEHLRNVAYYLLEKDDPTRYCAWDDILPDLEREQPAFIKAWRDYEAAHQIVGLVARQMRDRAAAEDL